MNNFEYYVGIAFSENEKTYFFSTDDASLVVGDQVIVETSQGIEIAKVTALPQPISSYNSDLALKPIMRRATSRELEQQAANAQDSALALSFCAKQVEKLKLEMTLLKAEYTFDRSKILITYVAEKRVDFRDLLKVLAGHLKTRIELKQLGSRDRAKLIGGLGSCGFPLCCSTFLNEFDGISISRAKNQMLSLNIPKLSGQCGKLLCCLKFEDEYYSEARKDFPLIGSFYLKDKVNYRVNSYNMINRTVRLSYDGGFVSLPLDNLAKEYVPVREKN